MTNDQIALIAAAISEGAYSTQTILETAKKYATALNAGLTPTDEDKRRFRGGGPIGG